MRLAPVPNRYGCLFPHEMGDLVERAVESSLPNRQMTDYEIFGYVSARTQPTFDEEPVADATMDDLDGDRLDDYLGQLRRARPQRLALVYLRYNDQITNSVFQRLNQIDALTAGRELRGLVQAGLIEQQSAHRWTYYTLSVSPELPGQRQQVPQEEQILTYAREKGSIGSAECQALLKIDHKRAWYLLKKLTEKGALSPRGKGKGRRYFPAGT